MERRANGSSGSHDPVKSLKTLQEKEARLNGLGRRLKHEADIALGTKSGSPSSKSSAKQGYVLAVESALAFMLNFQVQNLQRGLNNKKHDPAGWLSMLPLLSFFQDHIGRRVASGDSAHRSQFAPLQALFLLLHGLSIEEIVKCHAAAGPDSAGVSLQDVLKLERSRSRLWSQLRDANATISSDRFRADIHPWTTLDEVAESVVRVLRRWSADEDVDWQPQLGQRDFGKL